MAKIRNSMVPNTWGEGNEKIITMDNGKEYVIRNTFVPNAFGEGYEQEIVERGSISSTPRVPTLLDWIISVPIMLIVVVIGLAAIVGIGAAFVCMFQAWFG